MNEKSIGLFMEMLDLQIRHILKKYQTKVQNEGQAEATKSMVAAMDTQNEFIRLAYRLQANPEPHVLFMDAAFKPAAMLVDLWRSGGELEKDENGGYEFIFNEENALPRNDEELDLFTEIRRASGLEPPEGTDD